MHGLFTKFETSVYRAPKVVVPEGISTLSCWKDNEKKMCWAEDRWNEPRFCAKTCPLTTDDCKEK
jgi:hypothetical protein